MIILEIIALKTLIVAIIGYLTGSANTSLIVGRFYGVDVRQHGSGNAGATNTLRTLGKKAAVLVGIGDVLKGITAALIGMLVIGNVDGIGSLGVMTGGLAAVIGHNWPVFFGFKGGKGIFTTLAVAMMMDWRPGLMLLGVFVIVVLVTRYISLGSIVAVVLFPIVSALPLFGNSYVFLMFAAALAALAVIRHRTNIVRILNGTESKFGSNRVNK